MAIRASRSAHQAGVRATVVAMRFLCAAPSLAKRATARSTARRESRTGGTSTPSGTRPNTSAAIRATTPRSPKAAPTAW